MRGNRFSLTVLTFLLFAVSAPALDLDAFGRLSGDSALVSCRISGLDEREILDSLDSGFTLRVSWFFRLSGSDQKILLYARRDPLGDRYILYDGDWKPSAGPFDASDLLRELARLEEVRLDALGPWRLEDSLEVRFFIDRGSGMPPINMGGISERSRNRSSWIEISHPDGVAP